jgi:hypothetical protein
MMLVSSFENLYWMSTSICISSQVEGIQSTYLSMQDAASGQSFQLKADGSDSAIKK